MELLLLFVLIKSVCVCVVSSVFPTALSSGFPPKTPESSPG